MAWCLEGTALLCVCAVMLVLGDESCPVNLGRAATETQVLSASPRVYLLDGFLNGTEVGHLLKLMKELKVDWAATRDPNDSQDDGHYHQEYIPEDRSHTDAVISALEERIAAVSHIPAEPGTATISVSVRNATEKGLVNVHHDHNAAAMVLMDYAKQGKQISLTELRATLLAYLTDTEEGGETIFPCLCDRALDKNCKKVQQACKFLYENGVLNAHPKGFNTPFRKPGPGLNEKLKKASDYLVKHSSALCMGKLKTGLRVRPRAGRAILFFSNNVRGQADPRAWHGSCQVSAGQKHAIQRFLYAPQSEEETGPHASAVFTW